MKFNSSLFKFILITNSTCTNNFSSFQFINSLFLWTNNENWHEVLFKKRNKVLKGASILKVIIVCQMLSNKQKRKVNIKIVFQCLVHMFTSPTHCFRKENCSSSVCGNNLCCETTCVSTLLIILYSEEGALRARYLDLVIML